VVSANVLVVPCSISVNAISVADAGFISVWLFVEVIPAHEDNNNKVDVLHDRLTELHAAHQNLPPAIRTLRLNETTQNIHQKRTKSDNMIRT